MKNKKVMWLVIAVILVIAVALVIIGNKKGWFSKKFKLYNTALTGKPYICYKDENNNENCVPINIPTNTLVQQGTVGIKGLRYIATLNDARNVLVVTLFDETGKKIDTLIIPYV